LSEKVAEALDARHTPDEKDLPTLAAAREEYQHLLNELIEWVHNAESGLSRTITEDLIRSVRRYLKASSDRELAMFAKAANMPPL
jgi:hypothetical protein